MNPLPAQRAQAGKPDGGNMPSLPTSSGDYSASNRRAQSSCAAQRAYPWLLFTSTAVAAVFCLLYITKPVVLPAPAMISPSIAGKSTTASALPTAMTKAPGDSAASSLIPSSSALPGEGQPDAVPATGKLPEPPSVSAFEETNLRVQHVLTAEAPGGHLDRILLDVPVLYRSRELRWTAAEVAEARQLLFRLMDYQEKSHALRSEGADLLAAWNRLIGNSLPATELRADSPSLPANQDAADAVRPAGFSSTESIQIRPAGK